MECWILAKPLALHPLNGIHKSSEAQVDPSIVTKMFSIVDSTCP